MKRANKILVTGATGFLGSYLVKLLIDKGYQVRALKRPGSNIAPFSAYQRSQLEWADADVTDIVGLEDAFVGIDAVCHCAAIASFHPSKAQEMMRTNVSGTANVVNMCLHFQIPKLIHVSSIAALGRTRTRLEMDEKCHWVQGKDNSRYAITKHLAEQEVWRGIAEGLNATIVSPSVIVGSKSWEDGMAGFFKKIDHGLKVYPSGSSGFVDVRDVAVFMEHMLADEKGGERYILNAVNIRHQDFFRMIASALKVQEPTIKVGPFLAEVAWRVEWLKEKLLGTTPMATRESARASVTHYIYRSEKSLTVAGFSYRPFEITIQETAQQYLEAKHYNYMPMMLPF